MAREGLAKDRRGAGTGARRARFHRPRRGTGGPRRPVVAGDSRPAARADGESRSPGAIRVRAAGALARSTRPRRVLRQPRATWRTAAGSRGSSKRLAYLHHPLRASSSRKYIPRSLALLQEIQRTGDIFFPKRWMDATLSGHRSASAAQMVRHFLTTVAARLPGQAAADDPLVGRRSLPRGAVKARQYARCA